MLESLGPVGKLIAASTRYISAGMPNTNQEQYIKRMLICGQCEHFDNGRCRLCTCIIKLKARMATEVCPIGLWPDDIPPSKPEKCGSCNGQQSQPV